MKTVFLLLLLTFTLGNTSFAKTFEVVKEHSRVTFDVEYMSMTKVEGQFKDYRAFFDLTEKEDELSNVKMEIKAESIDTSDGKRDFHLKGQEFFFVANYPEVTFKAKGPVKISEGQEFKLSGELTIKDTTKPVTLTGIYKGKRLDPWGKNNYFFTLAGEIDRKDFGIIWNKQMDAGGYLVGDKVRLNITVQSQPIGEKTSFSTHMVPETKAIKERADLKRGKIKKLTTPTDANDHKAPKN
ncbi:MAG: YceI family protein [Bdellovibrionales bacterium]|nr:YceI family protein [Bdellovibrionales bacterium]